MIVMTRGAHDIRLEPSPYDLSKPKEPAPERRRKDPRLTDQRLTAFWVYEGETKIGRVKMIEYENRSGWWYVPEVYDEPQEKRPGRPRRPKQCGDPQPMRRLAVEKVVSAVHGK